MPEVEGSSLVRRKFKSYSLGYFHIDVAKLHTAEGRLYLLVAIDRATKFAFVELYEKATRRIAGDFLRVLIRAVPYRIHTALTDHRIHFTSPEDVRSAAAEIRFAIDNHKPFLAHAFEHARGTTSTIA